MEKIIRNKSTIVNKTSEPSDLNGDMKTCKSMVMKEQNILADLWPMSEKPRKKSHTCGSLYAKCSCSEVDVAPIRTIQSSEAIQIRTTPEREEKRRGLFHTYSHPDTSFIFTDENKNPDTRDKDLIITTKCGKVEITNPTKRLSTPNIGNYALLDVAVHPEVVLKVSTKSTSKSFENTLVQRTDSEQRRIRPNPILKKSPIQLDSDSPQVEHNDISQDEKNDSSPEITNQEKTPKDSLELLSLKQYNHDDSPCEDTVVELKSEQASPKKFDSAHKYFLESGILGPMGNSTSCLVRKTSKVVQDPQFIEHIRKNSKAFLSQTSLEKRREDSSPDEFDYVRSFVPLGKKCNPTRDSNTRALEEEIELLKDTLKKRDNEINELKRKIHKLNSVLQLTTSTTIEPTKPPSALPIAMKSASTVSQLRVSPLALSPLAVQQNAPKKQLTVPVNPVAVKKQGVSAESSDTSGFQLCDITIPKFEKDYRSKQIIKDAIMDNDFLKNISSTQVRELVDSMWSLHVSEGQYVIREGEVGSHLYVSAQGEFEVVKDGKVLGVMGPGKAFGELAILYNCTRTASIRVLCDSRVWVLDRRIFQQIMKRTGLQRIEENVNFLKSVPLLKNLGNDTLMKIADVLEVEFYPAGTYIIRQGVSGDTFFLISQGTVKVTQRIPGTMVEEEIRTLNRGDYFGEQALIKEDKRTANIIAMLPGVECLTLDRESFTNLIGNLQELQEIDYGDECRKQALTNASRKSFSVFGANIEQEYVNVEFSSLEFAATLGIGGFGRVELVKLNQNGESKIYALKCLKKQHIIDTRQEEHVFNERTIMLSCNSPFICRLFRTFRDSKYIYMLLEACMGGEIWTILRDRGSFDDNTAQFIIGCVLQAFDYLHMRGIVYRDLKPENLMLDSRGYIKLVDFGFAKYIGYSSKTWTFCGTPEYVAPEIILNRGHDRAVDYWALGILIHELLTGTPPFTASDPMQTYNIILKGIDMIDFPKHMSRSAIMLIKKLCRDNPLERLGYQRCGIQDLKKNKWFQGFDWDGLAAQTLEPPIKPTLNDPLDTSNFDDFPFETDVPPDENSGWDLDF